MARDRLERIMCTSKAGGFLGDLTRMRHAETCSLKRDNSVNWHRSVEMSPGTSWGSEVETIRWEERLKCPPMGFDSP